MPHVAIPRIYRLIGLLAALVCALSAGSGALAASQVPSAADPDCPPGLPPIVVCEPPPPGAPPAPPVPIVSTLIGVGNVPGVIIHPQIRIGGPWVSGQVATGSPTTASPTQQCASDPVFGAFSYAVQWSYSFSNFLRIDPSVTRISISNVGTFQDPKEHVGLGIISWFNEVYASNPDFVQMGFWRGHSQTWNDILPPGQVMIYMEFRRANPFTYNWVPLLAVPEGTNHALKITQDPSKHYYNFYLDGQLKWANVYMDQIPNRAQIQNETYNFDTTCDGGVTTATWTEPATRNMHVEAGHAAGQPSHTPWRVFHAALTRLLPQLGYQCGGTYSGITVRCGPYDFFG